MAAAALLPMVLNAQTNVCQILASRLTPDTLVQGSSYEQFSQLQNLVSSSTFASYGNASSTSIDGTLISDEVDAFLKTHSSDASWGLNRSAFLSMNFQQAVASGASSITVSHWSVDALKEIDNCNTTLALEQGFSATLKSVSPNRDAFAVELRNTGLGNTHYTLTQFKATPFDPMFKCNDNMQNVTLAKGMPLTTNTQNVSCSKDPAKHLLISIQSTAGAAPTVFNIESADEEIKNLKADSQAKFDALTNRVDQLDKKGEVAAFAASSCPAPWVPYLPAQGRFIRGLDPSGSNDPDGTSRAVESVQGDGIKAHSHTMGVNGMDTRTNDDATERYPNFSTDGANAGGGPKKATDPNSDGISESRPKNVALLYCVLR